MLPRTNRELALVCVTALLMSAAVGALGLVLGRLDFAGYAAALCAAFAIGLCTAYLAVCHLKQLVDPWYLQKALMEKSGQATPSQPEINKHVVTYLALVLEEWAETAHEAQRALGSAGVGSGVGIRNAWSVLDSVVPKVTIASINLRAAAEQLSDDWSRPLTETQAIMFADGVTDQAVVVAGLAIAAGIPGAPCYEEVIGSNLSKANPMTGIIDKDATGKWLKGANYQAPNLRQVLYENGVTSWPR